MAEKVSFQRRYIETGWMGGLKGKQGRKVRLEEDSVFLVSIWRTGSLKGEGSCLQRMRLREGLLLGEVVEADPQAT